MKKFTKRGIAIVLTIVMLIGLLAVGAGAATYKVKAGDNLSKIAKEQLGDASKWKEIYEANKDIISDPNSIYVGQELVIPGTEEPSEEPSEEPAEETDTRIPTGAVFTQTTGGMVLGYSVDGIDQYYGIPSQETIGELYTAYQRCCYTIDCLNLIPRKDLKTH